MLYNWLNESYRVTSSGGLFFNDGYKEQPIACDADRIAEHFLILHKAKIADRFETAMKDKRYGSDSAYTKDLNKKLTSDPDPDFFPSLDPDLFPSLESDLDPDMAKSPRIRNPEKKKKNLHEFSPGRIFQRIIPNN